MIVAIRVQDLLRSAGYPGLFALVVVENLFPPIPSESLAALAAATADSVVGALILYELARRGGRPLILRYGGLLRVDAESLDRSERRFERYGTAIVLGGRLAPGLRNIVSVPAGLVGMPRVTFTALTAGVINRGRRSSRVVSRSNRSRCARSWRSRIGGSLITARWMAMRCSGRPRIQPPGKAATPGVHDRSAVGEDAIRRRAAEQCRHGV